VAKYEEMKAAYFEKPSGRHVASRCGVSLPTARRYIDHGDPSRDLPPLSSCKPAPGVVTPLPPQPKRQAGKGAQLVDRPTYEAMVAAWVQSPTVNHVVTTCKVSAHTAKRYIEHGDPARDMPPIRERGKAIAAQVAAATDAAVVAESVPVIDLVDMAKRLVKGATEAALEHPESLRPEYISALLKTAHAVEATLKGKPSEIIGVQGGPDPLEGLTDAEVLELGRAAMTALEKWGYGQTAEEWITAHPVADPAAVVQ
jgi:hypothetical protein